MFSSVMSQTGSGKSTVRGTTSRIACSFISPQFVCAASGRNPKALGHKSRLSTDQVSAVKFRDQESLRGYIVLVDTLGFDDASEFDL